MRRARCGRRYDLIGLVAGTLGCDSTYRRDRHLLVRRGCIRRGSGRWIARLHGAVAGWIGVGWLRFCCGCMGQCFYRCFRRASGVVGCGRVGGCFGPWRRLYLCLCLCRYQVGSWHWRDSRCSRLFVPLCYQGWWLFCWAIAGGSLISCSLPSLFDSLQCDYGCGCRPVMRILLEVSHRSGSACGPHVPLCLCQTTGNTCRLLSMGLTRDALYMSRQWKVCMWSCVWESCTITSSDLLPSLHRYKSVTNWFGVWLPLYHGRSKWRKYWIPKLSIAMRQVVDSQC